MFGKLLLMGLWATTALSIEYDLSGVDWSKIDYSNLPFFVLWGSGPTVRERLDPVMTPGVTPSQHLHEFAGANVLSAGMTQADLSQATCSTFQAKADKSSYWNPALYFQDPKTGEFTLVPGKAGNSRKLYYSYKTAAGQFQEGITEFPKGFQMVAGSPMATTADAVQNCPNAECGYHQMGGKVATWTCQGAGNGATVTGFPKGITACPNGLRGQVMFPDCSNGQAFNPANPQAHVAFSTGDGVAGCPSTHPIRHPQIYYEINFDIDQFNGKYSASDSPFVLAFGDKTGFGFHADFMNGWDEGALASVMQTCRKGDGSNPQTLAGNDCFGKVGGMYTQDQVNSCSIQPPTAVKVATATVNALPGCQTLFQAGSTVNLKTCDSTVATIVKRSDTRRIAAGHGRFVEAKA